MEYRKGIMKTSLAENLRVLMTRRLFEKIIPALLLLASIAYIVDASYNPFLYFRF